MLVAENEHSFILTTNDDHARISGHMARLLYADAITDSLTDNHRSEEFAYAVAEHDRAWIDLDTVPIWNDGAGRPFSVADYPLALRLPHYARGLAELEQQSEYAALLCSLHYTSFRPETVARLIGGIPPKAAGFLAAERERQTRLTAKLGCLSEPQAALLRLHLDWLQTLDELSIRLCIPDDSRNKDSLRADYRTTMRANEVDGTSLQMSRNADDTVSVSPYPFSGSFEVEWKRKVVSKEDIRREGLYAAYDRSPVIGSAIAVQPNGEK